MSNLSHTGKRRASIAQAGLPISRVMHSLLSTLLTAIDHRVSIMNAMGDGNPRGYEPETCEACGGTGLIMVSTTIVISDDEEDEPVEVTRPNTPAPDGLSAATPEIRSYLGMRDALAAARAAASASRGQESSGSNATIPLTAPLPAPVPTPAPATSIPTTASSIPNTAPAIPAANLNVPQPMSNNGVVPLPSVLLAGHNRLGPGHQAPLPVDAVFATPGADRYYAVTKGIRVGVFAGWLNTSSYVIGVPSAASSRHATIEAAYDAYCEAYGNGLVSYI